MLRLTFSVTKTHVVYGAASDTEVLDAKIPINLPQHELEDAVMAAARSLAFSSPAMEATTDDDSPLTGKQIRGFIMATYPLRHAEKLLG